MSPIIPMNQATPQARRLSARRPAAILVSRCRRAALAAVVGATLCPALATAACPAGDPTALYCEDFSSADPLAAYTVVNPYPGNSPFSIAVVNGTLVFANTAPGLAFANVISGPALNYRNTLYEADLRFDTANPALRTAMGISWSDPTLSARLQVALQLDEKLLHFWTGVGTQIGERKVPLPALQPYRTYRVGFRVSEVPGSTSGRPVVLGFKGYIDGAEVFSETEDTLGVHLSALPTQLNPGFHGGSYGYSPVNQVWDNALVRKRLQLACNGFGAPLNGAAVTVKNHRVLPFKMRLTDEQGAAVTSLGSAPPVIQVLFNPPNGVAVDVTNAVVAVGAAAAGKQFVYEDGQWQFNLQTKPFVLPGTYMAAVLPGNGYVITPRCVASFVIR